MVSWVELVTKQFNASAAASEWFLGHMADDTWWPMQVSASEIEDEGRKRQNYD